MWFENVNEINTVNTNRNDGRIAGFQLRSGVFALTAAAVLLAGAPSTQAGDREWATAGKVLTGVVAGSILLRALEPAPCRTVTTTYYAPPTVVYQQPVVVQSAPVAVRPVATVQAAPVYAQPAPVYVQPAPVVYVQPAPVYVQPAPVVYYRTVSYGPHYHRHFHPRHCW